jgi:hypothetical protein
MKQIAGIDKATSHFSLQQKGWQWGKKVEFPGATEGSEVELKYSNPNVGFIIDSINFLADSFNRERDVYISLGCEYLYGPKIKKPDYCNGVTLSINPDGTACLFIEIGGDFSKSQDSEKKKVAMEKRITAFNNVFTTLGIGFTADLDADFQQRGAPGVSLSGSDPKIAKYRLPMTDPLGVAEILLYYPSIGEAKAGMIRVIGNCLSRRFKYSLRVSLADGSNAVLKDDSLAAILIKGESPDLPSEAVLRSYFTCCNWGFVILYFNQIQNIVESDAHITLSRHENGSYAIKIASDAPIFRKRPEEVCNMLKKAFGYDFEYSDWS